MAVYQLVNGEWVEAERIYVKRNGVFSSVTDGYVKRSGVWAQAFDYDVIPPNPPELTLSVYEDFDIIRNVKTLISRWIRVGIRLPGSANDPEAKLVRVLTTYAGAMPTTPLGGTYWTTPDSDYPSEAWSDWKYNSYGPHKDTSAYVYKQWANGVNPKPGNKITPDKDYHFAAWSQDRAGNWSVRVDQKIHIAKASVDMANIVVKETKIQPNQSGSWRSTGFQSGNLVQQNSPRSVGLWFYGNQFVDSVGAQTTSGETITVRSAQIYIKREDDSGEANAEIYLFWNGYSGPGSLPAPGSGITKNEITKLGTLAKGQGDWFTLPASFRNNLNAGIKCMGLDYKAPDRATAFPEDYSNVTGVAANLRVGEVHLTWEEQL